MPEILCPDCGEAIELHPTGWWSHVGLHGDCWRLSMDGPNKGEEEMEESYKIVRFCFDENSPDHRRVIRTGLTLEEAQDHCNDPDTHGDGWFDGYEEES